MTAIVAGRKPLLVFWFLLGALCLLPHIPSLFAWYNGDDFAFLRLLDIDARRLLAKTATAHIYDDNAKDFFLRPISFFSFGILAGHVTLARIFMLVLHLGCCVLVYGICRGFAFPRIPSALAALLFMVHPGISHTVYWITAICDMWTAFFCLLASLFFVSKLATPKRCAGTLGFFLLALLSKEMAITLPAILVAFAIGRGSLRKDKGIILASFAFAVVFFAFRGIWLGTFLAGSANEVYFPGLWGIVVSAGKYMLGILAPFPFPWLLIYPILFSFMLVFAVIMLFYLRQQGFGRGIREVSPFGAAIAISFAPIIGSSGDWRLHFPLALFAVMLGKVLASTYRLRGVQVTLGLTVLTFSFVTLFWSMKFQESGSFQRGLLSDLARIPEKEIALVGMPRTLASSVPLFSFLPDIEAGLEYFHQTEKKITWVAPANIETFESRIHIMRNDSILELGLDPKGHSYFFEQVENGAPHDWHLTAIRRNRFGKPTQLSMKLSSQAAYVYTERGLVRAGTVGR